MKNRIGCLLIALISEDLAMRRGTCALVAFLLLGTSRASLGLCVQGELNRVATVMIDGCIGLPAFAAERLDGTKLPWVVGYVEGLVSDQSGVVVSGTVTKKVHVTQYSDTDFKIEDIELVEQQGEWFVALETRAVCSLYPPGREVELYITDKCCDVIPPYDVPCALEVGSASPVPPSLKSIL